MDSKKISGAMLLGVLLCVFLISSEATSLLKLDQTPPAAFDAVSGTVDGIIHRMGWSKGDVKLSNIDTRDAKLGQTLIYEFDIQVGDEVLPLRLSEEITAWQYLQELPENEDELGENEGGKDAAVNVWRPEAFSPVLAPFQLAGPVDLWMQDAEELRLSMPHDVDAGVLKRVLLADGAVVTVEGAREVSLTRPLQLPLPLTRAPQGSGLAASLAALASRLRFTSRSQKKPLLSLRIVGPSSLTAAAPTESAGGRLKVNRLGSGAVELVSRTQELAVAEPFGQPDAAFLSLSDYWMWPLPSLNMSNSKLLGLEHALIRYLGQKAYKKGSFQLLKAKVAAASFVQIQFELEKKLTDEMFKSEEWPEWATRPSVERLQFELLAKVDGDKLLPISARQIEPTLPTVAFSVADLNGNVTANTPTVLPPVGAMTLDFNWEGILD